MGQVRLLVWALERALDEAQDKVWEPVVDTAEDRGRALVVAPDAGTASEPADDAAEVAVAVAVSQVSKSSIHIEMHLEARAYDTAAEMDKSAEVVEAVAAEVASNVHDEPS